MMHGQKNIKQIPYLRVFHFTGTSWLAATDCGKQTAALYRGLTIL